MSDEVKVPAWVPKGVVEMYAVTPLQNEAAARLLTDSRMQEVWKILRAIVPANARDRVLALDQLCIPEHFDEQERDLTLFDRLSAALFHKVVIELSQ